MQSAKHQLLPRAACPQRRSLAEKWQWQKNKKSGIFLVDLTTKVTIDSAPHHWEKQIQPQCLKLIQHFCVPQNVIKIAELPFKHLPRRYLQFCQTTLVSHLPDLQQLPRRVLHVPGGPKTNPNPLLSHRNLTPNLCLFGRREGSKG